MVVMIWSPAAPRVMGMAMDRSFLNVVLREYTVGSRHSSFIAAAALRRLKER